MKADEAITLRRDCEGILIPHGDKLTLPAGSQVRVTQSLGGSYTVMTDRGHMVRIVGKDADALGMEVPAAARPGSSAAAKETEEVEKLVWEQLKTCFDPEIPVNIVDLGLIYHCQVTSLAEGGNKVEVRFTLTAPGCGMGEVLKADLQNKILSVPGIKEVGVELVWDPPWDQSRISREAKLKLGML